MHFKLYYRAGKILAEMPQNAGFEPGPIQNLLQRLEARGHSFEIIGCGDLTDEQVMSRYIEEAVVPSVYKKFRIRQVFGSRRHSGWLFGSGVPALIVYEGGKSIDVYPHEDLSGRTVTIEEFLESLLRLSYGKRRD